jgi:hypothetical protein
MAIIKSIVCLLLIFTMTLGCTLFDSEDVKLSFIKVDRVRLLDTRGVEVSSSIKDLWTYHQDQLIGIQPVGTTIPVIIDGVTPSKITFRAGIKPNGANGQSEEYPFFSPLDFNSNLKEGETSTFTLNFQYRQDIVFDFTEDFESGNIFTEDLDGNKNTKVTRALGKGKDNGAAGEVILTKADNAFETTHFASYSNRNNKLGKIYLELDYKNEEDFFIGVITKRGSQLTKSVEVAVVRSDTWKRIYIDLTQKISNPNIENYQIVISSLLNDQQRSQATILFDNLRLVHF